MIKDLFPIFKHSQGDKPLVYLDSGATYQKPYVVIDAMSSFYKESYGTVHRGLYPLSEQATNRYEKVRKKCARFINATCSSEVIFTKGTTEGINFVAQAWALEKLKAGDEILLTEAEHHSNLLPWQRVVQKTGAKLRFIPINNVTSTAELSDDLINERTKIVSVIYVSNVLGPIWGKDDVLLYDVIQKAQAHGSLVMIDAAQAAAHKPIDVQKLNCDFLALSGHKTVAPTGVGILYINKKLHDQVEPYQLGGSMIHSAAYETCVFDEAPKKFEAGTPSIVDVIGLGASIDFVNQHVDFAALKQHEASLCKKLIDGLLSIGDVTIAGNKELMSQQGCLVSFSVKEIHPHDIAGYLGSNNIALRAGHHCAQPLVTKLGFNALLRVSFGMYNTHEDIDTFLRVFKEALVFFKSLKQG